jgi:hypothetical protein
LLGLKAAKGFLLVREVRKDRVKIGKSQNFLSASAQVDGPQVRIIFSRRENGPNQLSNSRAIEIRHVAKIQQDALPPVSKKIPEKFVDRLAFNQRKSSADVDNRDVSYLPGTSTETQFTLLGLSSCIFYRMPRRFLNAE